MIPQNIKRDKNGVAHVVGISGGKDSVCLALALMELEPRPYTYIYTPTGNELPEMVSHMEYVESLLGQQIHPITNGTLVEIIHNNKMIPNFRSRFCTRILKLVPAGRFYDKVQPVVAYIGLRNDEDEREGSRPGGDGASIKAKVKQDFPFQRWGWGIEEVWGFLNQKNITIPERTDCAWCFWQKLGEWYNLWLHHPDIYSSAESLEIQYGHTFRSPERDSWPAGLKELRKRFESGDVPERSLRMMEKRKGICRTCTM